MSASGAEDEHSSAVSPNDSGFEQEGAEMVEHPGERDGARQNGHQSASNVKDPLRPRRKKARRACFACQRAHLTCGDERPCQRCIKRGLQDACHDGVRKKAKYLHDAPNEVLLPGAGDHHLFNHATALRNHMAIQNAEAIQQENGPFYQNPQALSNFNSSRPMPPPMMQDPDSMNAQSFPQRSDVSPAFHVPSRQPLRMPNMPAQSQADTGVEIPQSWNTTLIDQNDPAVFNFDLASMNFGNHYGALEFGMLGHMATGASQTSPSDSATQQSTVYSTNDSPQYTLLPTNTTESPTQQLAYNGAMTSDWPPSQTQFGHHFSQASDSPHAFSIETGMPIFTSPDSAPSPRQALMGFEDSPSLSYQACNLPPTPNSGVPQVSNPPPAARPQTRPVQPSHLSTANLDSRDHLPATRHPRRRGDPSSIYNNVTTPYSYTAGFHSLIAYLQRRFATSPAKTLAIAQSLASIRPSFIATTKTLNHDDLIFMEKCFQRTLWEYEGFIEGVGTPTLVARRTGEIAAVGKEFCILTGWKREVLLGQAPNLNVNRGGETYAESAAPDSGVSTAAAGTGRSTPSRRGPVPAPCHAAQNATTEGQRLQPIFLAELLDDESVVEFYEGFARLAFGDSRGSVRGKGKLLKYRTQEDVLAQNLANEDGNEAIGRGPRNVPDHRQHPSSDARKTKKGTIRPQGDFKRGGIADEREMSQTLGKRDGKVECTICWTVKRDVFDIPMLIVMNFLPCI